MIIFEDFLFFVSLSVVVLHKNKQKSKKVQKKHKNFKIILQLALIKAKTLLY